MAAILSKMAAAELSTTAAAVCEFLEAALHTLLCERGVYPAAVFELRRKFGVPVRHSRHPGLAAYVAEVVRGVHAALATGEPHRVVLAVVRPRHGMPLAPPEVVERFVFEVGVAAAVGDSLPELQEELASFLVKISTASAALGPPAADTTFRILLYESEEAGGAAGEAHAKRPEWVPADRAGRLEVDRPRLVPLRSVDCDHLLMQLYVEENAELKRRAHPAA